MSDKAQQARIELLLGELRLPTVKRIYEKVGREVSTEAGRRYQKKCCRN